MSGDWLDMLHRTKNFDRRTPLGTLMGDVNAARFGKMSRHMDGASLNSSDKGRCMADFSHSFTIPATPFGISEQVRAFVENGVNQAQQGYERFKGVAEENNVAVEAVFDVASKGISDYSAKMLGFFQVNTFAVFDLAQQMATVTSLPQAAELLQTHTRKQMETLTDQSRELAELSRKVVNDAAEPFKDSVTKLFQPTA